MADDGTDVVLTGNGIYNAALDVAKAGEIAGELSEAQKQQQEAQKNATRGLAEFESKIQNIRNKIVNALIDSGIFDQLSIVMSATADLFTDLFSPGAPGMKAFEDGMDWIVKTIDKFKAGMGTMSFGEMLTEYIWKPIKKAIGGLLFGKPEEGKEGGAKKQGEEGSASGGLLSPIVDGLKSIGKYLLIGG